MKPVTILINTFATMEFTFVLSLLLFPVDKLASIVMIINAVKEISFNKSV